MQTHIFGKFNRLLFRYELILSSFFTKLSGVQSASDGWLLVEPWCHIEDYFERRMTEMSERNASVVPVKP